MRNVFIGCLLFGSTLFVSAQDLQTVLSEAAEAAKVHNQTTAVNLYEQAFELAASPEEKARVLQERARFELRFEPRLKKRNQSLRESERARWREKSLATINEALSLPGLDEETRLDLSLTKLTVFEGFKDGKADEKKAFYEQMVANPRLDEDQRSELYLNLAKFASSSDELVALYEKALANTNWPFNKKQRALDFLSIYMEQKKDFEAAESYLRRVRNLPEATVEQKSAAQWRVARLFQRRGLWEEAAAEAKQAYNSVPKEDRDRRAAVDLAREAQKAGQTAIARDLALVVYNEKSVSDQSHVLAASLLALQAGLAKDFKKAHGYFTGVPHTTYLYDQRSNLYRAANDLDGWLAYAGSAHQELSKEMRGDLEADEREEYNRQANHIKVGFVQLQQQLSQQYQPSYLPALTKVTNFLIAIEPEEAARKRYVDNLNRLKDSGSNR